MIFRTVAASLALAGVSMPAIASDDAEPVAATAAPASPIALNLAANTPVALTLNSALSTKANTTGEKFSLTVAQDILSDGKVVIPRGSRAIGLITFAKGNGSFGKSGKMELAFKYIEIDGKQIPLEGMFYQEGEGNTAGTIGAIAAAGVIGGFVVKGHSVNLVSGRDFNATIKQPVPFLLAQDRVTIEPTFDAGTISMATETEKERKKRLKAEEKKLKDDAKKRTA